MTYRCSNYQDKRCSPCSHEQPHEELKRWDTHEGCTANGFVCELTGKAVVCKPIDDKPITE